MLRLDWSESFLSVLKLAINLSRQRLRLVVEVLFVCPVRSLTFCARYVNLTGLSIKMGEMLGKNRCVVFTDVTLAGKVILNNQRSDTSDIE